MERAGIVAVVDLYGRRRPVGACASCERVRPLPCRGLCESCRDRFSDDGTLEDWGYTKADRVEEFARLRRSGLNITEAGRRVCASRRTAGRYEAALIADGRAPWREWEMCRAA